MASIEPTVTEIHVCTNDCSACNWESPVTSAHHSVTKSKALTAHSRYEALCMLLTGWGAEGWMPKHTAKDENSSSSWEQQKAGEFSQFTFVNTYNSQDINLKLMCKCLKWDR